MKTPRAGWWLGSLALVGCGAPAVDDADASRDAAAHTEAAVDAAMTDATPRGDDATDATTTENDGGDASDATATGHDGGGDTDATTTTMEVTFYGWADNSPPGADIAYPGFHAHAGGAGTYDDPITFATDPTEFAPGTVLYVPLIAKYVRMEDACGQCETDWRSHRFHIDVWMNSDATHTAELLACEDDWTRDATAVETHPPSDRPVTAAPLFDPATGTCSPRP